MSSPYCAPVSNTFLSSLGRELSSQRLQRNSVPDALHTLNCSYSVPSPWGIPRPRLPLGRARPGRLGPCFPQASSRHASILSKVYRAPGMLWGLGCRPGSKPQVSESGQQRTWQEAGWWAQRPGLRGGAASEPAGLDSTAVPAMWASLEAQLAKNPPAIQETWVRSPDWEDPLANGKATHSSILA